MYNLFSKAALEQQARTSIHLTGCLHFRAPNSKKMNVTHLLIDFIVYRDFKFEEKFSRKNKVPKYDTLYTHKISIIINFLHDCGTYIKIDKPTLNMIN